MIRRLAAPALLAALGAGLPLTGHAFTLVCDVAQICEGSRCHKAEAGMNLAVVIQHAESAQPMLISDAGPVHVQIRNTGGRMRFEGTNAIGTREMLVADMKAGSFDYLRRGVSGPAGDVSYQGVCKVTP